MDQVKFVEDSLQNTWSDMVYLSRSYLFIFLKASLPQKFFNAFLNALSHLRMKLQRPALQQKIKNNFLHQCRGVFKTFSNILLL